MSHVADANVAIAVLNPADLFHEAAVRRCVEADEVAILNITRAEALVHPTRAGKLGEADSELSRLGFVTHMLDNSVAERACRLRAEHGNRSFPMVDAVVVAFAIEKGWPVLTNDSQWPSIPGVEVLRF